MQKTEIMKTYLKPLAYAGGALVLILILFSTCCTVVDSGEVGIRCHRLWVVTA